MEETKNISTSTAGLTYRNATGPIPYTMLNDYMFRAILQKNERVLRGLIGSLLHLSQDDIKTVEITNPIRLGDEIDSKTFILDIHLQLNNDTNINLEMQVLNEGDWTDRSLSYLCRTFDHLYAGESYADSCRAIQIGILDYTLFPDKPEFYAEYRMMNVKNHHIYSDKLQLHVLELDQIERATEEDRRFGIDRWARLFKATTWEEICMTSALNEFLSEAAEEMYRLNEQDIIRQQCRAREEFQLRQRRAQRRMEEQHRKMEEQSRAIEEQSRKMEEQSREIEEQSREIKEQNREIEEQSREIEKMQHTLTERQQTLAEQQQLLSEKDLQIEHLREQLAKLQNTKQ